MRKLWITALLCGGCPLVIGIAIFILYYFTFARWLMFAGILNIYAGSVALIIGLCCLTIYVSRVFKENISEERWLKIAGGYFLLLINIPMAVVLVSASGHVGSLCVVRVINSSPFFIEDILLQGPANNHHIERIPPATDKTKRIRVKGTGSVKYTVSVGTKTESGVLFGYVMRSGHKLSGEIAIDAELNVSVKQEGR
ncbi:MAG: hypothetical protein HY589_04005 [Candidatus Omnitrophica bacterium]|nr:hypothetical protein [Candidatus Omnitrophota bacterium]